MNPIVENYSFLGINILLIKTNDVDFTEKYRLFPTINFTLHFKEIQSIFILSNIFLKPKLHEKPHPPVTDQLTIY